MRRKSGYLLQRISDTDYLLPYGQLIADHKRGISMNSTGVYVWNLLENEIPREKLTEEYLCHFCDDPAHKDDIAKDLDMFLDQLIDCRIIEDDAAPLPHADVPDTYLKIGGLVLAVNGPKELISASHLNDFSADPQEHADQNISVIWGYPDHTADGSALLRNNELAVYEREDDYLLIFPTLSQINEVHLSKDGASVSFYCTPPVTEELKTQFFHALRHVFLYLAQRRGMYAIHSASICYRDKAWLFSAVSGTGKSTHTNMWERLYKTAVINGDLNLLAFERGKPVIHGIPWCGTSEIFSRETLPLGGIVMLKQAQIDFIEELTPDKKALFIMQRFISPMWKVEQLKDSVRFADELSRKIHTCRLYCTKNDSAAELIKKWVDDREKKPIEQ